MLLSCVLLFVFVYICIQDLIDLHSCCVVDFRQKRRSCLINWTQFQSIVQRLFGQQPLSNFAL